MTGQALIFYTFAAVAIFSALMVITVQNAVRAVLFLVLAFVATAGVWLLMEAEFLAIILVLVYVGAVMVLFLFVVMMLDFTGATQKGPLRYLRPSMLLGVGLALGVVFLLFTVIGPKQFTIMDYPSPAARGADYNDVAHLGMVMYTDYVLAFIAAGCLLLVAMVAAISLAYRGHRAKRQRPSDQVKVKASDRIRLVKMSPGSRG